MEKQTDEGVFRETGREHWSATEAEWLALAV